MSHEDFFRALDAWVEQGLLRPLERAFARFLRELAPAAEPAVLLAGVLASHQLGRGHICLDLEPCLERPWDSLGWSEAGAGDGHPARWLAALAPKTWHAALAASPLVAAGAGATPLVLARGRLYLRRFWQYEQAVAAALRARASAPPRPLPAELPVRLTRWFPDAGRAGPDWQKLACALAARGTFTLITGGPGTGKTTTVVRLLALLQELAREQEGRHLRIRLAAPTGKAAARLTESIAGALRQMPAGTDLGASQPTATTLHRLLGSRPDSRRFQHGRDNPLHLDVLVVDEASMVDLEMMAALLEALPARARLVLLGDKDQLASVEAGAVLGDLCEGAEAGGYAPDTVAWLQALTGAELAGWAGAGGALAQGRIMLRESRRFGAGSGIGRLALAVNRGEPAEAAAVLREGPADLARLTLAGERDSRLERLLVDGEAGAAAAERRGYGHYLAVLRDTRPPAGAAWTEYEAWAARVLQAFDRFRLLCALRAGPYGVVALNRRAEAALRERGLLESARGSTIESARGSTIENARGAAAEGERWYEGRPVMLGRNDYGLGLMNGDIGIALRVPASRDGGGPLALRAFFPAEGGLKAVLPSRLSEAETVYAMTVHKSQGSEFEHCALVLPERPTPVLTRELVYTGITRARRWFSLALPEPGLLDQAIRTRTRRASGLAELLD